MSDTGWCATCGHAKAHHIPGMEMPKVGVCAHYVGECELCSGKGFVAAAPLSIKPLPPWWQQVSARLMVPRRRGAMLDLPGKVGRQVIGVCYAIAYRITRVAVRCSRGVCGNRTPQPPVGRLLPLSLFSRRIAGLHTPAGRPCPTSVALLLSEHSAAQHDTVVP